MTVQRSIEATAAAVAPRATGGRLGEILVAGGALTQAQLDHALAQQTRVKKPLGQILYQLKYVTDEVLRQAVGHQVNVPYVDLDKIVIDTSLAKLVTANYARLRMMVPLARMGQTLTVAMDDPTATATVEELHRLTRYSISVVTSSADAIQRAYQRLYGDAAPAGPQARLASVPDQPRPSGAQAREDGPIVVEEVGGRRADDALGQILAKAFQVNCSDIHLEMLSTGLRVRFRIDGVLRQLALGALQKTIDASQREVISRIKILAKLDIAERRRPQDGSFRVVMVRGANKTTIDLRISVVPSYTGESVVIRVLDGSKAPRSLKDLDLAPEVAVAIERLLSRTTGIMLVTGPTGSGKSTTLYACLGQLYRPEIRILTAEDPVEYVYEELSQCEVNEDIGNTFAGFLRVFLRHDPEVIMVGEVRDRDTAEMAFRAAQTGHFLLSTLHTNSAIAALPRLIDLQIEPSLIASSLAGVVSQRLVRKVCTGCRREYTPNKSELSAFFDTPPTDITFYKGVGCDACGGSGYKGRMMIADLWIPDEEDFALIVRHAPFDDIRRSAERTTFSMAMDANSRLRAGKTTMDELLRVLPHSAIVEHRARFSVPS